MAAEDGKGAVAAARVNEENRPEHETGAQAESDLPEDAKVATAVLNTGPVDDTQASPHHGPGIEACEGAQDSAGVKSAQKRSRGDGPAGLETETTDVEEEALSVAAPAEELADDGHRDKHRKLASEAPVAFTYAAVALDIEGTTTPISFVHDKLFPYVRRELASFLRTHWDEEPLQACVDALRKESASESNASLPPIPDAADSDACVDAVCSNVGVQMDQDRKTPPLKNLQSLILAHGFQSGAIISDVYPDVPDAMRVWHANDIRVYIYSSGAVDAQKNLFGHTAFGDLGSKYISGYFDPSIVGPKKEKTSYEALCTKIGLEDPARLLFITDIVAEADAAMKAGLQVLLAVRPGNAYVCVEDQARVRLIASLAHAFPDDARILRALRQPSDSDS
ncbi:Enolase-phosphatase E1 [Porphyridium purpureum]|uniref:Enolase-phosphatase E1 n=1 Tax=Porphyridium purpureum TaxID=35688 RepID=A0A5J4ZAN5_PORPP|nr:Enolase-phosphatase E1 [Porphyridium purpureum]|eukprot:POR7353..scf295_1